MKVRTRSRGGQWMAWLCAALVFLAIYIVLSQHFYNAVGWNPFDFRCHRLMLPLFLLFVLVARATRWDGVVREAQAKAKGKEKVMVKVKRSGEGEERELKFEVGVGVGGRENAKRVGEGDVPKIVAASTSTSPSTSPSTFTPISPSQSGEELFEKARALPHQAIPDFDVDSEYLDLLGKSAAAQYAPALAKLGEYAMRRAAWVEAYYWMKLARLNGMHGLSTTLREIRQNWAMDGFPEEAGNVSGLFPEEAGSVGRALIHLDSGRDAAVAHAFLKAHYPEFL